MRGYIFGLLLGLQWGAGEGEMIMVCVLFVLIEVPSYSLFLSLYVIFEQIEFSAKQELQLVIEREEGSTFMT